MLSLKKANVPAATNTSKPNRTSGRRVKANVSSPLSRNCPPNPGFVRLLKTRSELDDRGVSQMTRMVDSFRAGLKFKFAPTHSRILLARNLHGAPFCGRRWETRSMGDTPDFRRCGRYLGLHNIVRAPDHAATSKRVDDETGPGDVERSARCPQLTRAPN